jgi:hypothetical protein
VADGISQPDARRLVFAAVVAGLDVAGVEAVCEIEYRRSEQRGLVLDEEVRMDDELLVAFGGDERCRPQGVDRVMNQLGCSQRIQGRQTRLQSFVFERISRSCGYGKRTTYVLKRTLVVGRKVPGPGAERDAGEQENAGKARHRG